MSHHNKAKENVIGMYKQIARTVGLLVCAFAVIYLAGKGNNAYAHNRVSDFIPVLGVMLLPVAGYILTWYKETPGTYILIAGGLTVAAFFITREETDTALLYGLSFITTGALFMLHLRKRNEMSHIHKK